jgi:hypothetical protein
MRLGASAIVASLALAVALPPPGPAGAQFAINGRKIAPVESNFAGVRQVTPRYGLVVQVNHDARPPGDVDLALVDEVYAGLLRDLGPRPIVRADALPLVVTSQAKIERFGEGGRRRMFRFLEPELRRHRDLHLSPAAIFISDEALADTDKARSVLRRALSFHFDTRFREAIESMDRPVPDQP